MRVWMHGKTPSQNNCSHNFCQVFQVKHICIVKTRMCMSTSCWHLSRNRVRLCPLLQPSCFPNDCVHPTKNGFCKLLSSVFTHGSSWNRGSKTFQNKGLMRVHSGYQSSWSTVITIHDLGKKTANQHSRKYRKWLGDCWRVSPVAWGLMSHPALSLYWW